jgi:hypothetical protein
MPTIIMVRGWRVFFYANEGTEPIHVHAKKGEAECKFWLHTDVYDIEEDWEHGLTPRLRREVRKILFDHFDLIVDEWLRVFGDRRDEGN